MRTLNLGIVAHVDAGKTSLTERLLYDAGVITEVGSVDAGNTQTDSLALERQRGITIKSAVVSFRIGDVTVNLIDTPGHPDFIAEVERVLNVLDGAVLVISAVEGVQAQTRVLMRTLQRLRIPTLLFVNKVDRSGAQDDVRMLDPLGVPVIAMGSMDQLGTREAVVKPYGAEDADFRARLLDLLAEQDDALLAKAVESTVTAAELRAGLVAQTRKALVHPVFFGSAITAAGVDALTEAIPELLPAEEADAAGQLSGSVFKVDRGPAGEKIAYARLFSGTLHARDRVPFGPDADGKVTAIRVFDQGTSVQRSSVAAGQIATLTGLVDVRVGDALGEPRHDSQHYFAPPSLETVVVPTDSAEKGALHTALTQLAEQDPLINLRQDDVRQELFVSLYGEVQKEVIQSTLAAEYGLEVSFRETTVICIERPNGVGEALDLLHADGNPFKATIGLRVEPGPIDSGIEFRLDIKVGGIPIHVYKSVEEFHQSLDAITKDTLRQGIHGWQVTDCVVTMTQSDFTSPDTAARDYRLLLPLVLMDALKRAGTRVCEPMHRFYLEAPAEVLGQLLPILATQRAIPHTQAARGSAYVLEGDIPAARVHALQQQLPGLTRGEGVLETTFDHHRPVTGVAPSRPRTDLNPLRRKEYLLHVQRRV